MPLFKDMNLPGPLQNALDDLAYMEPTPIQQAAFSAILSGRDVVGISQTGTGKTLAYVLPLLKSLSFSKQVAPRILILAPTRELVLQIASHIESVTTYMNVRVLPIYGGVNMNTQKQVVAQGADIVVATPGRLYDLTIARAMSLKQVRKLVIDEVDVMLDLGFQHQLTNIFDLLPDRRQHIMFSATMMEEVDLLINQFFIKPERITIAVSGTPLHNIQQSAYTAPNFYTKANLLRYLLKDEATYSKTLIFVATKKNADRLFEVIKEEYGEASCVVHANKSQNYRERSIRQFDEGKNRILITTDVMARGLDLDSISQVISFDVPTYPENYMHRIGRTGRAKQEGQAILFYTPKEEAAKQAIEKLMNYTIPMIPFPAEEVAVASQLLPEERPKEVEIHNKIGKKVKPEGGCQEKKAKNQKTNQGGSYRRKLAAKYKKPQTKGDKNANRRNKRR